MVMMVMSLQHPAGSSNTRGYNPVSRVTDGDMILMVMMIMMMNEDEVPADLSVHCCVSCGSSDQGRPAPHVRVSQLYLFVKYSGSVTLSRQDQGTQAPNVRVCVADKQVKLCEAV